MFFDSQIFSTAQLSQLLQVSESTIKRWADSDALKCFKTPGGHRKFRLHDVLEFLDQNGYDALGFLVRPKEEFEDFRIHWQITRGDWGVLSEVCERMLLNGEREQMFVLMSNCVTRQVPLAKAFDLIVMPAMQRIAHREEAGELRVYEGRRAHQTMIEVLSHLTQLLHKKVKGNGVAVLACTGQQLDYISLAVAALLLEEQGWTVVNLGGETPWAALLECLDDIHPQLAVYTTSGNEDLEAFKPDAANFGREASARECCVVAIGAALSELAPGDIASHDIAANFQELLETSEKILENTITERKQSTEEANANN